MFSKAKLKRFNEEVGCAPPPTAYDPKPLDKAHALSIDRSNRWKENKDVTPAPNAYSTSVVPSVPRTPVRALGPHNRAASSSHLNSSSASTASSTGSAGPASLKKKFRSPQVLPPRLVRSGSYRQIRCNTDQLQLQQERDALKETVLKLEERLLTLQQQVLPASPGVEKEVQTDPFMPGPEDTATSTDVGGGSEPEQLDAVQAELNSTQEALAALQLHGSTDMVVTESAEDQQLVLEQIKHLTQLRDNLEVCVANKDLLIAQLQEECHQLTLESQLYEENVSECHDQLVGLEAKLSETLLDLDCEEDGSQLVKARSVVGRVSGLVKRYEALMHRTSHLTELNTTLTALNAKVAEYEDELSTLKTEATSRRSQIVSLKYKLDDLTQASQYKEMIEEEMREEIDQHNQEMSLLEEGYTSLELKVAEAEERAHLINAERARREEAEQQVKELTVMVSEAEVLQQFLEKEVLSRENEVSCSNLAVENLTKELASERQRSRELQDQAESQLDNMHALQATLAAREYDFDKQEENICALRKEITTKEELACELRAQLAATAGDKDRVAQKLEEVTLEVATLKEDLKNTSWELKLQKESVQQLQRDQTVEIECLKDQHEAELQGLREHKEKQEMQVVELRNQYQLQEQQLQQLEDEIDDKKQTISRLEEKIVELTAEIQDGESYHNNRVQVLQEELDELNVQYSEALLERDTVRRALIEANQELQDKEISLHTAFQDLSKALSDLNSTRSDLSSKSEEHELLENNIRLLSDKYTALERQRDEDESDNRALVQRLQNQLQQNQIDLNVLNRERDHLNSVNTGFTSQIQQLRQDLAKKSKAIEESKQSLDLMREEKLHVIHEKQQLEGRSQELEQQLQQSNEVVGNLREELVVAKKTVDATCSPRTYNRLKSQKEEHETSAERMVKELHDTKRAAEQMQDKLDDSVAEISGLKKQIAISKQELETFEEKLSGSREEAEELKVKLSQSQEMVNTQRHELEKSNESLSELNGKVGELEQELGIAGAKINQLEGELVNKEELDNANQEIDRLKKELSSKLELETVLDNVKLQLEDRISNLEVVQQDYDDAKRSLINATDELNCVKQENAALQEQRNSHAQELVAVKKASKDRYSKMQEDLQRVVDLKDEFARKLEQLEESEKDAKRCQDILKQVQAENNNYKSWNEQLERSLQETEVKLQERDQAMTDIAEKLKQNEGEIVRQKELVVLEQQKWAQLEREQELNIAQHKAATAELETLKTLQQEMSNRVQKEVSAVREALEQRCREAEAENDKLKEKCRMLEKLVEPFREQLEGYESERAMLLSTQSAAQREVSALSQQYAALLGHQNHKQKIQHVVKLKEEKLKLTEELMNLRAECDRNRKTIARLEEANRNHSTSGHPAACASCCPGPASAGNKENMGGPAAKGSNARPTPLRPSNKMKLGR